MRNKAAIQKKKENGGRKRRRGQGEHRTPPGPVVKVRRARVPPLVQELLARKSWVSNKGWGGLGEKKAWVEEFRAAVEPGPTRGEAESDGCRVGKVNKKKNPARPGGQTGREPKEKRVVCLGFGRRRSKKEKKDRKPRVGQKNGQPRKKHKDGRRGSKKNKRGQPR